MFPAIFKKVCFGHHIYILQKLLDNLRVTALRNTLIYIIKIIVIISKTQWQTLNDKSRKIFAVSSPLFLSIALNQLLIDIPSHQGQCLFFQILWICNMQVCDLLCNLCLCFCRCPDPPQLTEGVHVKRQIIQLISIDGHRRINIVVKLCIFIDILPYIFITGMENMGSILVYMDTIHFLRIDIATDMIPLFQHQTALAGIFHFSGKYRPIQTRANNQVIIDLSVLLELLRSFLLFAFSVQTILLFLIGIADLCHITTHTGNTLVQPDRMVTDLPYRLDIMRHEQKRCTALQQFSHAFPAFFTEIHISYFQCLIYNKYIRTVYRSYCKSQSGLHTGRKVLHR